MENIIYLGLEMLEAHPNNPRKEMSGLDELAASIKAKGIMQNLTVVPSGDKYRVVIGHRRMAAAKMAGVKEVPCIIADMTEKEQIETMLLENMQRSDLTVLEQAEGFQMMMDLGDSVKTVAKNTGFSESTIKHRIKLLDLNQDKFKESVLRGGTIQDYIELEKVKDPKAKTKVLDTIGTPDFNATLKRVLEEQEYAKRLAGYKKALDQFATEVSSIYSLELPKDKKTEFVASYSRYANLENPEIPDDANETQYYYTSSGYWYSLYKVIDCTDEKPEENPKLIELNAKADALEEEAYEINHRHMELRTDFIKKIGKITYKGLIECVKWSVYNLVDNINDCDNALFLEYAGIEVEDEFEIGNDRTVNDFISHNPEKAFVFSIMAALEGNRYLTSRYYGGIKIIEHKDSDALDAMYKILKSLGYEMSQEEKQMQDGTHEIFSASDEIKKQMDLEEE